MTVFIIAGGTIQQSFAKSFIEKRKERDNLYIACDKGFEACLALNLQPNIIVGDFDSVSDSFQKIIDDSTAKVIRLNPVKDDTDTEAALNIAIRRTNSTDSIYILGATGGRIDHLLGNISLLAMGLINDRKVYIADEHNFIQIIGQASVLEIDREGQFGKYVSVFPYMEKASGVTMSGFKYPLTDATLEGFNTLTVSNEIVEEHATIEIKSGYLIVCESMDSCE